MINSKIVLGPLLGVESDTLYTVCVLLSGPVSDKYPILHINNRELNPIKIDGEKYFKEIGEKEKYYFYRFEYELENVPELKIEICYEIKIDDLPLSNNNDLKSWRFSVCPKDKIPDIAFVSCNGNHDYYPTEIDPDDYKGWERLNQEKPDYIVMTGDQIYADKMWDKVAGLEAFVEGSIDKFNKNDLKDFYINLYIDSWSNPYMSLALAQIPNIMTWDDHDIVDGYGSYGKPYYEKLRDVFDIAKDYYELFQIRSKHNRSLIKLECDYTICLKIRRFAFIIPDTRSHRDLWTVLNHEQYKSISNKVITEKSLNISKSDIVCFVLPVPIAYRDFSNLLEKGAFYLYDKGRKFNKTGSDDLIDHWDHIYHKAEQKIMLDLIFEVGEVFDPRSILIVSGDVHSSGASKITKHYKYNEQRYATQLVSSPMVNESSGFMDKVKNLISEDFKVVDNYSCNLLEFGSYPSKDFYTRNFMIVKKDGNSTVAQIFIETKKGWTGEYNERKITRNLNNFKKNE